MRHTLVRVGGLPYDLHPGRDVVLGRHRDCDLTIPSQRVSRRHSEIVWSREGPLIRDLGSQNGIKVNGRRVKEQVLQDGDELEVGPFLCTYRCVEAAGSVGKLGGSADESDITVPMTSDNLAGTFEQMSVFEVLQVLESTQKTGSLEVFSSQGDASLEMQDGRAVYAASGSLLGDDAILELCTWTEGQFVFSGESEGHPANVRSTIRQLLFEASRRIDESKR